MTSLESTVRMLSVECAVFEQPLPGKVLTRPHDLGETPVVDLDVELVRRLAAELEMDGAAAHVDVSLRSVVKPKEPLLRAYSSFPIRKLVTSSSRTTVATTRSWLSSSRRRSRSTRRAQRTERAGERHEVGELVVGTIVDERVVIPVLLAPAGIAAGCLQMAVGMRRDPHIGPRRRDDQRA